MSAMSFEPKSSACFLTYTNVLSYGMRKNRLLPAFIVFLMFCTSCSSESDSVESTESEGVDLVDFFSKPSGFEEIDQVFTDERRDCYVAEFIEIVGPENILPIEEIDDEVNMLTSSYVDYLVPEFKPTQQQQEASAELLDKCADVIRYAFFVEPTAQDYECLDTEVIRQDLLAPTGIIFLPRNTSELDSARKEYREAFIKYVEECDVLVGDRMRSD